MNNILKERAIEAMIKYLESKDWVMYKGPDSNLFYYLVDPVTGLPHRSDFAFFIQTERDQMNYKWGK